MEAHFRGQAFAPHRHDTYAIGITLAGVQIFRYRGERRHCLPGQCHILHPDEMHDGGAGTDEGFGYRIAYVDPSLIQQALGGKPLPFVADPVLDASLLPADFAATVWDIDDDIDDVARDRDCRHGRRHARRGVEETRSPSGSLRLAALSLVRDALAAQPARQHSMDELERLAGLDRWTLARQFRAAFGTSPGRFRTMRQLDRVRRLLRSRQLARRSRGRRGLRRPEPHVAALQARLWPDAGEVGRRPSPERVADCRLRFPGTFPPKPHPMVRRRRNKRRRSAKEAST